MESIFEEWDGHSGTGNMSARMSNGDPMSFSMGDSVDGAGFGLNQVSVRILWICPRAHSTILHRIQMRCFLLSESPFLRLARIPRGKSPSR